jgi:sulfatase maturation enzyme AslB (radical SAM superfamily)
MSSLPSNVREYLDRVASLDPSARNALASAAARAWGGAVDDVRDVLGASFQGFDPDLVRMVRARAQAAIKPVSNADESAVLAAAISSLGFFARAMSGDDGHAVGVALDAGTLHELSRWYEPAGSTQKRRVIEAIGKLLGYPTCCFSAYAMQERRGPWGEDAKQVLRRAPKAPLLPPLQRLGRLHAVPHHPCAPNCPGSVVVAEETLAALRDVDARAAERLEGELREPVLLAGEDRVAIDGEWIGDVLEVENVRVLSASPGTSWLDADRLEFSDDSVTVVTTSGASTTVRGAPLYAVPGTPLSPGAVRALFGGPLPETHKMPDLPWLGWGTGANVEHGFLFSEARHASGRLELVFSKGGRSLVSWLAAAEPGKRAFKNGKGLAFGYVGQQLAPDELALLEAVWKKAEATPEAALENVEAYRAAQAALEEVPRHSRPTKWLGEGPAPAGRLKVLGAKDAEKFFHVDYEWGEVKGGDTSRVGIIYRCNQWCSFCNLADMDVKMPVEKVRAAIKRARERGSTEIILTGGEPTLSPHVFDHVAYAKELGFTDICIQTNAVRIARSDIAERLRAVGLTKAQVSLHGPDAAVSDRLTQAPGTHAKTVEGIGKLLEQGVTILVNHLIFKQNYHLLVPFVEFAKERWGRYASRVVLQFRSAKHEFNTDEDARENIPLYAEFTKPLLEAIALAKRYGFGTSHVLDPVGVPSLCVLGSHGVDVDALIARDDHPAHHAWESDWFTRIEACRTCGVSAVCQGVRKDYVQLYGESEFHPLPVLPATARRLKA